MPRPETPDCKIFGKCIRPGYCGSEVSRAIMLEPCVELTLNKIDGIVGSPKASDATRAVALIIRMAISRASDELSLRSQYPDSE